ncbi:hypothetical protein [Polyangium spumosum]|uniref:SBBP repeat-containing protein n=1 Tax=Polyangium spumosum TaxID=889282 RepID=A0A6N7PUI4_9BACT|nr:hypothetical protein [Polyangium spumosum]MRG94466.1 hypothetical protein [Polyangium spumosum]
MLSRRYGGWGFDDLGGLTVDDAGSIFLTGAFESTIDFGPVTGSPLASLGGVDLFITKLSANGTGLWARRAGNTTNQRGLAIAAAPNGDVLVAGDASGTLHIDGPLLFPKGERGLFLTRMSTEGAVLWAQIFGGPQSVSFGVSLAVDPASDSVVAAGFFDDVVDFGGGALPSAGNVDAFVARFAKDGSHLGARVFGGPGPDGVLALDLGPSGELLLGGAHTSPIDFGGGVFTTSSLLDANGFLVRLSPPSEASRR